MILKILLQFLVIPSALAIIMYLLVHFQLLLFHKLLKVDLSDNLRKRICITTSISSFVAAIILIFINNYMKLHLNTGSV
ncbi:MAG: hypothetical protein KKE20_04535 [Nanoarchaeota archaeon]|nr:hypothetical protein [Nanoarchaeota archaeon]